MQITRRNLLQGGAVLGVSALGLSSLAAASPKAYADEDAAGAAASDGLQYGFLIDISKCVYCEKCVTECRKGNGLTDDTPDRRVISKFVNDKRENLYVSTACMHCAEPSCVEVCPAGALSKGGGGIVSVDKARCIGCKYCYQACPYEVPKYNSEVMDKCDCCLGAGVAAGEVPYCVRACMFGALRYGKLEDLEAEARGKARPIAEANGPSCLIMN